MDELSGAADVESGNPVEVELSAEESVGKGIAPVKREYQRRPTPRCSSNGDANATSSVVKEKKSKRQLKRERQQVFLFRIC